MSVGHLISDYLGDPVVAVGNYIAVRHLALPGARIGLVFYACLQRNGTFNLQVHCVARAHVCLPSGQ